VESARRSQEPETAAGYMATAALRHALFGDLSTARLRGAAALRHALFGDLSTARLRGAAALALSHGRDVDSAVALALALASDTGGAEALVLNLDREYPLDTLVQHNYLPEIRAEIALQGGDPAKAVDLLQAATPYEMGTTVLSVLQFFPAYERGRAYLQAHNGTAAAAEFQKIIDHPDALLNAPVIPAAKLGLARAYALVGDKDKSRTAYQDFLGLWKNADPEIPILVQAKAEYAKLQQ
jgi:tetratricopeptide (TPR) repeat protein